MVTAAMKLKDTCSSEKAMTNLNTILKIRDIILPTKLHIGKAIYYIAQGTLLNVMWQPEWEGSLGEKGYKYMYG